VAERILVTGASGFVGSHLLEALTGAEVCGWTRSDPPIGLASAARWQRVDLADRVAVNRAIDDCRPTIVYHCAGSPHVGASWHDAATPLASNVLGTHHLFDAIRSGGRSCRLLIPGSATVYASSAVPIDEQAAISPVSPYALSKFAQEELGRRAVTEDGIAVVITRSFNHTGPRQAPAFFAPSVARQIALIERGAIEPILKVGNLDARRDFTDVRDIARAYAALVQSGEPGEVYNVASGSARSMREILDAMLARTTAAIRVDTDPSRMRPHDTPLLVGDAAKLRAATGWTPRVDFDRMIDDLLEYWRRPVTATPAGQGL
jgi:GDP-4-dehydro-6-deoxy-D-mannose reductase